MSQAKVQAEGIVQKHVLWSMGMGAIPIPILDTIAVSAMQYEMLKQVSNLYGFEMSENMGKSLISMIAGGTLVRMGASAVKTIPIIGSFLGGGAMVVLSGASTYAIGSVFIQHFESGGDLFDIDTEKFKNFYKEKFEQGKEYASEMREKAKNSMGGDDEKVKTDLGKKDEPVMEKDPNAPKDGKYEHQFQNKSGENQKPSEPVETKEDEEEKALKEAKIAELNDLKSKGILTEEEYERMKKKIMG
ncbi:DUF697 domain-containing protein [Bernardetia sp.]|uniref:DUF697 domain-containing protein n=1 Tax=Bernardetia sp. TaxID=1937974 RepID=UPI0025BA2E54|nr:DUF697 domain-containing protein [Bernardetia sp.]